MSRCYRNLLLFTISYFALNHALLRYHASVLLAPGLGDSGLSLVLFLLCGFRLFGILLPTLFGLVLLAFLVAHG